MIIDFHTHVFPDAIATNAVKALGAKCGNSHPLTDGTLEGTSEFFASRGVDKAVLLNITTNPKQQTKVNDFAISTNDKRVNNVEFVSFGSVHPEADNVFEELDRLKQNGIKGVKLHPDYQNFFVDEKRMLPIYEKISELGLIPVFHAGVDIGLFEPVRCTPQRLKNVLKYFSSPVIASHYGGYLLWNEVEQFLVGENVYFDTAFSFGKIPPLHAKRIINTHGADKILLGSDLPWSDTKDEIAVLESIDLSESDLQKICYINAQKLLK